MTFNLYSSATTQNSSTLLFSNTQTVSISGSTATATSAGYTATATGTDYWVATFNGDTNNAAVTSSATAEPVTITGMPNVTVTKTADSATITPGQTAGFTVTITNSGTATATGVTLSDPLPAGVGDDVVWTINTSKNTGNYVPADFVITGTKAGSQSLTLASSFNDTLAPGQSIAVDITAPTFADDVSSGCTTQCVIPCSNFDGTVSAGQYLWFTCAVNVQGLSPSQSTTVSCSGETISFTCGGENCSVQVPNSTLTFAPDCTTATTSCNRRATG